MEYRTSNFDLERDHLCQHLAPPLPTTLRSSPLFFNQQSEALVSWLDFFPHILIKKPISGACLVGLY